ncbi:MAG: hypothetical protein H6719_37075 [Sandaracinaceae bacterium]|nr:hypothetical protein [Sandaracinaceae bacterium]
MGAIEGSTAPWRSLGWLAALLASGCYFTNTGDDLRFDLPGRTDAGPGGADAGPPPDPAPAVTQLDLLFVVDNSNDMVEEQSSFLAELPYVFNILGSGDFDQDGTADFPAFTDVHVGVVTTDMGTGSYTVPTCALSDFGDDGVLQTVGNTSIGGCVATYPSFLDFVPGVRTSSDFAVDVACVASVGSSGCGFEQPLEAGLKAVSPGGPTGWTAVGYEPPSFFQATPGRGDGSNAGFVRDGSVLAIVTLTTEEDCSIADPTVFDNTSRFGATDLNLRCFAYAGDVLHNVERYVQGFLQLRRFPRHLVFAPIVGIPADLAPSAEGRTNYPVLVSDDLSIRDDRMEEQIDAAMPGRLVPSCNVPGRGLMFPPPRIVRVAQGLEAAGAQVTVQSICQESYRDAMQAIVARIRDAAAGDP